MFLDGQCRQLTRQAAQRMNESASVWQTNTIQLMKLDGDQGAVVRTQKNVYAVATRSAPRKTIQASTATRIGESGNRSGR